ncbi:MAG TPA: hypothetical protein VGO64_09210 [Candidatus Limnocylindrales bacterium]|nr:hypothetical protein [Candidatus Limnocylindrales bacterium]
MSVAPLDAIGLPPAEAPGDGAPDASPEGAADEPDEAPADGAPDAPPDPVGPPDAPPEAAAVADGAGA